MKKQLLFVFTILLSLTLSAQDLQKAKTTSAVRLFGDKDDLTSVLTLIPSGSIVEIVKAEAGSDYLLVIFDEQQGYIQANSVSYNLTAEELDKASLPVETTVQKNTVPANRYDRLIMKYGSQLGKLLYEHKIWKGLTSDMVIDSWGRPSKINMTFNDNSREEEWIYSKKWLLFKDNVLVSWGPVNK